MVIGVYRLRSRTISLREGSLVGGCQANPEQYPWEKVHLCWSSTPDHLVGGCQMRNWVCHLALKPSLGRKPLLEFTSWEVMEQLLPMWHVLPHDPSHYRSTGEDSCETTSLWSNNHPCPNQTRNGTQAASDPKVPFHLTSPHDLDIAHGFEFKLFIILVLARKPFSQWSDLHASTSICP
jgi:hypothetical protein